MTDGSFMTAVVSRRKVECILYPSDGSGTQLIIKSEPRRMYIEFRQGNSGAMPAPYPKTIPTGLNAGNLLTAPAIYKFKDCPAMVTGEWYIDNTTPGNDIVIITETYQGD